MNKKRILKLTGALMTVVTLSLVARFSLLGAKSLEMQPVLGVESGSLRPCEKPSNCFHSESLPENAQLTQKGQQEIHMIKEVLESKNFQKISEKENYLYYTAKSSLFGFIDDIEFYLDGNNKLNFRSASRVGHSDLGVNKERIKEVLKNALQIEMK